MGCAGIALVSSRPQHCSRPLKAPSTPRAKRPSRARGRRNIALKTSAQALVGADFAAIGATVFSTGIIAGCWWMVSTRMSTSIDARNLRTRLNDRLQEAQLKLLDAGGDGEDTILLREEVGKMKALLKVMEKDAEQGRAIQGASRQPRQLTPQTYIMKSLRSIPEIARWNASGKEQGDWQQIVTLGVIFMLMMAGGGLLHE